MPTVYYRGAPQEEKELQSRDFPGIFLSSSEQTARGYGESVSSWTLKREDLLDINDPRAERMAQAFERSHGEDYDAEQQSNYGQHQDEFRANRMSLSEHPLDVFLFPTTEWVSMLRSQGFNGMRNGYDIFVFDKNDLQPYNPKPQAKRPVKKPTAPATASFVRGICRLA